MQYGFIYKTTNTINDKCYIGQHICNDRDDRYIGSGVFFKKAVKKYGKENFKRIIICYCENKDELDKWEKHFINVYNSQNENKGYNIDNGGNSRGKISEITKRKLSENHKGIIPWNKGKKGLYKRSEETREKTSKTIIEKYIKGEMKPYWKGKNHTDEHKKKLSDTAKKSINYGMKGKKHSIMTKTKLSLYHKKDMKRINQYSTDNIFIETYESLREAERKTGISHNNISQCCKGKKYKSVGGYIWRYANE